MTVEEPRKGWRRVNLKDVCREITVGHVGPMATEYVDEGIPFLRSQNVQAFRVELSELKYVSPHFHRRLKKSAIGPGDVLVVRTGYPGTACVVPESLSVANCADLVIIRPSAELDSRFLADVFNSAWGRGTVAGKLVGVAQQHFNIGAARELLINLPPLPTQRRIASILSAYDEQMENNRRRIQLLEQAAQLLYKEWFVHLRFPGHEHVKIMDGVPDGWERKPLGEIAPLNYGKALKQENRIPGSFPVYGSSGVVGTHTKALVEGPGIIVGRKGNVGSVYWCEEAFHPIDTVYFIGPEKSTLRLYYALLHTAFMSTDVAVPGLNRDFAHSHNLLIPESKVAELFEEIVSSVHKQIHGLQKYNQSLAKARDLLLPRLMNGEIAV